MLATHHKKAIMKHSAASRPKPLAIPIAWHIAENAALRANTADTCDDRVTEEIFDVDDERAEVDIIVHGMQRDAT
jgi:hypothetical protein